MAYSIHDGRYKAGSPRISVAPPVQLFHPIFGHFLDDIRKTDDIPEEIIRQTIAYMKAATAVYENERKRRDKLNPLLSEVLGVHIQAIVNSDNTRPDGVVELSTPIGFATIMQEEDKNEKGDGNSDPSAQAGFSYARTWAQDKVFILCSSCCSAHILT